MIRIVDIILVLIGIIVLMPFFIIIGLTVLISSRGGVFYLQSRVGRFGKDFTLFKFRSMAVGADKKGLLTVGNNDTRITSVGKFLRKYKLDELPQLVNVLFGQMSIVGPRPEVRKYVDLYDENQMKVLNVRPGITDYASVYYKNENALLALSDKPEELYINQILPDKINLNMRFINNPTLANYFKIIGLTIKEFFC